VATSTSGWYGNIKIYGSNFPSDPTVSLYRSSTSTTLPSEDIKNVFMPDSSTLQVTVSIPAGFQGSWNVIVSSSDGSCSSTLSGALTVN
jgi:hypothetical protein